MHRIGIAWSSKTRNVGKIVYPSEVLVPCVWLLDVPDTWLQTTENDVCCQFPILSLEAVKLRRELKSLLLRHQANHVTHFSKILEQVFFRWMVLSRTRVLSSFKSFIIHFLRRICFHSNLFQNCTCSFRELSGITRQMPRSNPLSTGSDL